MIPVRTDPGAERATAGPPTTGPPLTAEITGVLQLSGARLAHPGGRALCLDEVATNRLVLSDGFRTDGELRLRGAEVSGEVNLYGAHLAARERALRARGMTAGELVLVPAEVAGLVDLSRAQVSPA